MYSAPKKLFFAPTTKHNGAPKSKKVKKLDTISYVRAGTTTRGRQSRTDKHSSREEGTRREEGPDRTEESDGSGKHRGERRKPKRRTTRRTEQQGVHEQAAAPKRTTFLHHGPDPGGVTALEHRVRSWTLPSFSMAPSTEFPDGPHSPPPLHFADILQLTTSSLSSPSTVTSDDLED